MLVSMGHSSGDLHDEANQHGDVKVRNLVQCAEVSQSQVLYQCVHILGGFDICRIPPGSKERLAASFCFRMLIACALIHYLIFLVKSVNVLKRLQNLRVASFCKQLSIITVHSQGFHSSLSASVHSSESGDRKATSKTIVEK